MAWQTVFERLLSPVIEGPPEGLEDRIREAVEAANLGQVKTQELYGHVIVVLNDEARRLGVCGNVERATGAIKTSYHQGRSATLDAWGRRVLKSLE